MITTTISLLRLLVGGRGGGDGGGKNLFRKIPFSILLNCLHLVYSETSASELWFRHGSVMENEKQHLASP